MDVMSDVISDDVIRGGACKDQNQSGSITRQPTANGKPENIRSVFSDVTKEAPHLLRSEDTDTSNDSLIDSSLSNDVSRLLPALSQLTSDLGLDGSAESPPPNDRDCEQKANQKWLPSTNSTYIKEVAGDECCAHCLLACLYCELLSMCSALGACFECGVGGASCCDVAGCCCCCVEVCTEDTCTAVLDCAFLEDCCCASADCLEMCSECCSICFPS